MQLRICRPHTHQAVRHVVHKLFHRHFARLHVDLPDRPVQQTGQFAQLRPQFTLGPCLCLFFGFRAAAHAGKHSVRFFLCVNGDFRNLYIHHGSQCRILLFAQHKVCRQLRAGIRLLRGLIDKLIL